MEKIEQKIAEDRDVKVIVRNRKNVVIAMQSSDSSGQSANSKD